MHHDVSVRTTLTLDDDLAAQLQNEAARQRLPFKQVVNKAIRLGLRAGTPPSERKPFHTQARSLGLKPGFDPDKLGQLGDDLETQATIGQRRQQTTRPRIPRTPPSTRTRPSE